MKTEAQYIAENIELRERNQKLEAKLFLANSKLEECNRIIQELQEKLNIRTARLFSPKTETETSMQIDEAESILEEEKKEKQTNKGKKQKQRYSVDELEKKVSKTIYIDPDEKVCPTCGSELVVVSESVSYKIIYHSHRQKSSSMSREVINARDATASTTDFIMEPKKIPSRKASSRLPWPPLSYTRNSSSASPSKEWKSMS